MSFWLPGIFSSFSAVPQQPGWSLATVYYHTTVSADAQVATQRQITRGPITVKVTGVAGSLNAAGNLFLMVPSYAFEQPVLGGQLALGMMGIFGNNSVDGSATVSGTVGPFAFRLFGSRSDGVTNFGDLYPQVRLRWNDGAHNFMTYITGDIPVGDYDPERLANIGIGHGALDAGIGYTYFDMKGGHELSAVFGATYNFQNATTQYQNGVDLHLDWEASQFVSEQVHIGVVGYFYDQVTPDIGALPFQGTFESKVVGIGPEVGYFFPLGKIQGYLQLKGYKEFGAVNRPAGWNAWVTLSFSAAPKSK